MAFDYSLKALEKFCHNKMLAYTERESEQLQQTAYHYTDFSALKSIIEKQQLWLTAYKFLNWNERGHFNLV